MDKLILLCRKRPVEFEIHRREIRQTHNLILTTQDEQFAKDLVSGYNNLQAEREKQIKILSDKMTKIIEDTDKLIKKVADMNKAKKTTKKNGKKRTYKRISKH